MVRNFKETFIHIHNRNQDKNGKVQASYLIETTDNSDFPLLGPFDWSLNECVLVLLGDNCLNLLLQSRVFSNICNVHGRSSGAASGMNVLCLINVEKLCHDFTRFH